MSDANKSIRSLRRTNRDVMYLLLRNRAQDVIDALRKHSFKIKDPDLWYAANNLAGSLQDIKEYESSGLWIDDDIKAGNR